MAKIDLVNVTFAYDGGEPLFSDLSLQIDTRWKLGLIGRNGRGKTTLLKLLCGDLPFEGKISTALLVERFPPETGAEERTTLEIVEETVSCEPWQLERELSLLELAPEILSRPFDTLSGGERTKILLAALFLKEDRFLLIDEPTNHLDLHGRELVARYLQRKKGFVLVSHDRDFLDRCVDHVLSINRDDIQLHQGNFSTWQMNREHRNRFEQAENSRLRKEMRRLNDSAKKAASWSRQAEKEKYGNGPVDRGFIGTKAAGMMKRAKSTADRFEKAADAKSALFKNSEVEDVLSLSPLEFHRAQLIDLAGVTLRYGENTVLRDFSLTVHSGERIALSGTNGCGKSGFLELLVSAAGGPSEPTRQGTVSGRILVPPALKISYLPQDTSFLAGRLDEFIESRRLDESFYRTLLHKLGFSQDHFEMDLSEFSAGQRKKVLLASCLCDRAHLYIWDEPLNYIDVISRIQIEEMLVRYKPTLIFVEHDKMFLDAVATRIVQM